MKKYHALSVLAVVLGLSAPMAAGSLSAYADVDVGGPDIVIDDGANLGGNIAVDENGIPLIDGPVDHFDYMIGTGDSDVVIDDGSVIKDGPDIVIDDVIAGGPDVVIDDGDVIKDGPDIMIDDGAVFKDDSDIVIDDAAAVVYPTYGDDGIHIYPTYGDDGIHVYPTMGDDGIHIYPTMGDDGIHMYPTYGDDGITPSADAPSLALEAAPAAHSVDATEATISNVSRDGVDDDVLIRTQN